MKKMSLFYKIYFSVVAGFLVLLTVGLFFLSSILSTYEASQPTVTVEEVIDNYLQKGDLYGAVQKYNIRFSKYQTEIDKEYINAKLKELKGDEKLTYGSSAKKRDGYTEVYAVKAGKETLVTLYLTKAKDPIKYGIKGYRVGYAEFSDNAFDSVKFIVPSDVKLKINGVEVKANERTDLEVPKVITDKIGDDKVVGLQSFTLKNLPSKNFVAKAYAANGNEVKIVEKDGVYTVEQYIEPTELEAIKTHALNASQGYAKFMQDDATKYSISHYFDTKTEFYDNINKTQLWVWDHESYRFDDVSVDEAHKYSDTLYSCRVRFVQVLVRGKEEYKDRFDKIVYMEKTANGLKVIDMPTATAE